jgi:heme exporter protein C
MLVRTALLGASGLSMLLTLGLVFLWVPTDAVLGVSQRIFYIHVPMAFMGFAAFGVVLAGSVGYLWRGSARADSLAHAAAEIGVLFMTLVIVTGSLWSRPVWGVWWTWSPQLTTSLVLWFIYVAYLMLRAYAPPGDQAARYAAVLGIIGFIDVPIVYMAGKWWRDVHPGAVIGPLAEPGSLDGSMALTLLVGTITFTFLFTYLLLERYALRRQQEELAQLRYQYA